MAMAPFPPCFKSSPPSSGGFRIDLHQNAPGAAGSTPDSGASDELSTAKSSSTLPPAYMIAMTMPARFCPSARAPDIDTKATESTPTRPTKKSRIIESSKPRTTGNVPTAQHQLAKSVRPFVHAATPEKNPAKAIAMSSRRNALSVKKTGIQVLLQLNRRKAVVNAKSAKVFAANYRQAG